jgi:hypothetical protein
MKAGSFNPFDYVYPRKMLAFYGHLFHVFEHGFELNECLAENIIDFGQQTGERWRLGLRQSPRA